MKEILTEWRKFVNEVGDPYSYYTPSHWRQVFSHPDTTIDNLIPICSECNSSMGVEHMDSFIKKFYPQNINSYMNKIII